MFSWYKIENFSAKHLLATEIISLEFFSKNLSIRRTARRAVLSYHLFDTHALLIKIRNFSEKHFLALQIFPLEILFLYQEHEEPSRATSSILMCSWYKTLNFQTHFVSKNFRKFRNSKDYEISLSLQTLFILVSNVYLNFSLNTLCFKLLKIR